MLIKSLNINSQKLGACNMKMIASLNPPSVLSSLGNQYLPQLFSRLEVAIPKVQRAGSILLEVLILAPDPLTCF